MRRGFSLIEVIVAIAIMIIIAAVITPNFIGALDKARVDRAEDDLDTFNTAIANFHTVIGKYPASMTHLAVKITQTDNNSCGTAYT
ncbi:MAG: prepilin-type N-terminal cleavage/methylation domain-containing protein, partial [Gemmatimonadetes bacterium]|nr:prepilin-type N-terminal cleavage/methylation domain-containing protein [Gemmatimonadota bacterium]